MASMYISRLRTVVKSGILSSVLGKESLLQDSVEILIGRGKSEFWNYRLIHSIGIASFTESQVLLRPGTVIPVNTDSLLIHQRRNFSVVGEVSVAGPLFQVCGYHVNRALCDNGQVADSRKLENKLMDASCPSKTVFGGCISDNLTSRIDNCQFSTTNSAFSYRSKRLHSCSKASMSLKNREQPNNSLIYGYVAYNLKQRWSTLFPYIEKGFRDFHSSSRACFSAGTASDVTYENSALDDQVGGSAASSEEKISAGKTLKLLSGSCYLPHPDKEETGGEDAHFICSDEQAIGVADGVGGWADLGIDAGQYSRELMSNSVAAIQEEPKGSVDPARVLEKAHSSTKAKGSSTACIIALTDQGLHAINLGDSGFMVVRDGCTIFRSPVQQHDFNFTYQLQSGDSGDLPSSGQIFTVPVAPGDVIIAGTDGLFDNLYNNEITAVVVHAMRAGLGPQVTAQKIAALARQRAQDSNRQTPFSTAAQDAGFRYYGGKLDDITVVVSYVTSSEDENQSSSQASGFV